MGDAKLCEYCGEEVLAVAKKCRHCGEFLDETLRAAQAPRDIGQDAAMRMLLPVGRSGFAVAAGYLGLLSPLMIFAPFAILTGALALREMKKHPERHGMGRAIFGLVMGVIFTVLYGVAFGAAALGK